MKKLAIVLLLLTILSLENTANGQSIGGADVVANTELVKLIQGNYLTRQASNRQQRNEFEKINKNYKTVHENLIQVMYVKDRIYKSLRNVEEGMKQGRQMIRISKYSMLAMEEISLLTGNNLIRNPDVILLRNDYVTRYREDIITMMLEIHEEILKVDDSYLVSYHDRQRALNRIQSRVYQLYIRTKGFNLMLRNYEKTHILRRNRQLNYYITKDLALFNRILRGINQFQDWN